MNWHEERRRNVSRARDALLRAAALLLDDGVIEDAAPCAALLAAGALVHLRKADEAGPQPGRDGERAAELATMLRDDARRRAGL